MRISVGLSMLKQCSVVVVALLIRLLLIKFLVSLRPVETSAYVVY